MTERAAKDEQTMSDDELFDVHEVARRYGCVRSTLLEWLKRGLIPKPVDAPGRSLKWRKSEVLEHIRNMRHKQLQEAAR